MNNNLGTLQGLAARFGNMAPATAVPAAAMQGLSTLYNYADQAIKEKQKSDSLAELFAGIDTVDPKAKTINVQSGKYDPESYMKTLKDIESSGGNYKAINKQTGAMGAYQFLPSTLKALQKRTGESFSNQEFISNPKLQDKYFKMLVEDNVKTLQNMDIPVNNFTLWAAHNLGPKQAKELIGSGALSDRTRAFIKSNLPGQEPTRENYIKTYGPKFGYTY